MLIFGNTLQSYNISFWEISDYLSASTRVFFTLSAYKVIPIVCVIIHGCISQEFKQWNLRKSNSVLHLDSEWMKVIDAGIGQVYLFTHVEAYVSKMD